MSWDNYAFHVFIQIQKTIALRDYGKGLYVTTNGMSLYQYRRHCFDLKVGKFNFSHSRTDHIFGVFPFPDFISFL